MEEFDDPTALILLFTPLLASLEPAKWTQSTEFARGGMAQYLCILPPHLMTPDLVIPYLAQKLFQHQLRPLVMPVLPHGATNRACPARVISRHPHTPVL